MRSLLPCLVLLGALTSGSVAQARPPGCDTLAPDDDAAGGVLAELRQQVLGPSPPPWFLQYVVKVPFEPEDIVFITPDRVIQVTPRERDLARAPRPLPVAVRRIPLSPALAARVDRMAMGLLMSGRRVASSRCQHPEGTSYRFARFQGASPPLTATAWSPPLDSSAGLLVHVAENLRRLARLGRGAGQWHLQQVEAALGPLGERLARGHGADSRPDGPPLTLPGLLLFVIGVAGGLASGVALTAMALRDRRRSTPAVPPGTSAT